VALQSLKDLGRLTYRRFLELFRHMVGLLGRMTSPSQGLYLHRTTQHRKTRTNIYALSGIKTHDPSNQPAKTHASDRTATVTGKNKHLFYIIVESKAVSLLLILNLGTRWGEWSASRPGRALPPGKGPPVPIGQETGWAPEPVWKQRL
jgi:hypothetical protein